MGKSLFKLGNILCQSSLLLDYMIKWEKNVTLKWLNSHKEYEKTSRERVCRGIIVLVFLFFLMLCKPVLTYAYTTVEWDVYTAIALHGKYCMGRKQIQLYSYRLVWSKNKIISDSGNYRKIETKGVKSYETYSSNGAVSFIMFYKQW